MKRKSFSLSKLHLGIMVILGWFALVAQFYINALLKANPVPEMIIRYFTYFTILTNLIVALSCTVLLFKPGSKWGIFFSQQQSLAAITVYIVIVGLIYNTILRFTWAPKGLQRVVDEILHSVIPILFLIYWLAFTPKNRLQWKDIPAWLIFPFVYIVFVLLRGSASGFYPYPFIDRATLGLNKVFINAAGITLVFIIMSLVCVFIGKLLTKNIERPIKSNHE